MAPFVRATAAHLRYRAARIRAVVALTRANAAHMRGVGASGGRTVSPPHCRDAPRGVSEAEGTAQIASTLRRLDPMQGTDTAAPQTPHGASLQWGGNDQRPLKRLQESGR
jgi:hypothetical protein